MAKRQHVEVPALDNQRFLEELFALLASRGLIEVRALKQSGGVHSNAWFAAPSDAYEFATSIGREANVYFGVAKRKREGGSKSDVLSASALWFDLDAVNKGWSTDACLDRIGDLPHNLQPSAVVRSGGGLHGYFFLNRPIKLVQRIEALNTVVRESFAGDNVQNADRILRVPGTYNVKRGKPCELVYCAGHLRYDPDKLTTALKKYGPVFVGDAFPTIVNAKGRAITEPKFYPSLKVRLDELWGRRVKYHGGSGGSVSLDEAILLTTCRLHCLGWRDHRVIDETLRRVRDFHAQQAAHEHWDWSAERENVAKKLERWKARWPELKRARA